MLSELHVLLSMFSKLHVLHRGEFTLIKKAGKPLGLRKVVTKVCQARHVITKFGGATKMAKAMKEVGRPRCRVQITKWTLPRSQGGTGGIIPNGAIPDVLLAARHEGIYLSSEDLDPRPKTVSRQIMPVVEVVSNDK